MELVLSQDVFDSIAEHVNAAPDGLETGVSLFGAKVTASTSAHVVLAVSGPGKKAVQQPAHYSGDEDHSNAIFEALRSAVPGIEWIGELHVHPRGMTWLSGGDRRTVKKILLGADETLHPHEFIAGVMQRNKAGIAIYPYYFNRDNLEGQAMRVTIVGPQSAVLRDARLRGIQDDRSSVCTKPTGGGTAFSEAPGHHWLRQWWKRVGRHGRTIWDRAVHAR
jgi:proteasome lid subunit RPN8/RPN11